MDRLRRRRDRFRHSRAGCRTAADCRWRRRHRAVQRRGRAAGFQGDAGAAVHDPHRRRHDHARCADARGRRRDRRALGRRRGRARPHRDILGAAGRRAADLRRLRQPDQSDHKIRVGARDGKRRRAQARHRNPAVEGLDQSASLDNLALTLHSDSFNIGNRAGPVNGSATADAFVVDNASIAPLVSGKLRAELAGTLSTDALTVASGTLHSDALDGAFNGDVSLADGSMTMQLKADVVSAALPAPVRGVLAERTEISAKLGRDAAGGFSAETVSIVSGALNASGNARLDDKSVDAALSGALADVSLLAKDAKGAIEFALAAKGEISGPDISLTVTSDRIEAAQREISESKADRHRQGRSRQSGCRRVADRHRRRRGAGWQGDAVHGWRQARGQGPVAVRSARTASPAISCSTRNSCRSAPSVSSCPTSGRWPRWRSRPPQGDLNGTIRFADSGRQAGAHARRNDRRDLARRHLRRRTSPSALWSPTISAPGDLREESAPRPSRPATTVVRDIDVTLTRDGDWTGFDGGATVSDIPAKAAGRLQVAGRQDHDRARLRRRRRFAASTPRWRGPRLS